MTSKGLQRFKKGGFIEDQVTADRLNALIDAIEARTPQTGVGTVLEWNSGGFSYSAGKGGRGFSQRLGFQVYAAADDTDNGVRVAPSVVSGVSTVAAIPEIDGDPITDDPAPILDLTEDTLFWIALKMTVIPETEEVESGVYQIKADAGLLSGDISVESYASVAAMDADTQDPTINSSTGAVTANGIYVLPLAIRGADGSVTQAGFYGPIGVRMCASGKLQVSSPVYAVVDP